MLPDRKILPTFCLLHDARGLCQEHDTVFQRLWEFELSKTEGERTGNFSQPIWFRLGAHARIGERLPSDLHVRGDVAGSCLG
jgi:hypothetical protein